MALSRRSLVGLTIGTAAALGGCSTTAALAQGTVVIDVRTPAEFASGHLDGATNI
ncbi:MAG: rhodanese-like domain-containing protein, partial [Propionibacteriaceae bacterium]